MRRGTSGTSLSHTSVCMSNVVAIVTATKSVRVCAGSIPTNDEPSEDTSMFRFCPNAAIADTPTTPGASRICSSKRAKGSLFSTTCPGDEEKRSCSKQVSSFGACNVFPTAEPSRTEPSLLAISPTQLRSASRSKARACADHSTNMPASPRGFTITASVFPGSTALGKSSAGNASKLLLVAQNPSARPDGFHDSDMAFKILALPPEKPDNCCNTPRVLITRDSEPPSQRHKPSAFVSRRRAVVAHATSNLA
mmetsp:Transcript_13918/g.32851  ORF Transcript_13918/g.32851 Transcript_13918/m.32851 type:complete len:251 (+) Transcript_13918:501-1253(+)